MTDDADDIIHHYPNGMSFNVSAYERECARLLSTIHLTGPVYRPTPTIDTPDEPDFDRTEWTKDNPL